MKRSLPFFVLILAALSGCVQDTNPSAPGLDGNSKADLFGHVSDARRQVDRAGRPEITNFTIRLPDAKVAYNSADSFEPDPELFSQHRQYIAAGVLFWDALDHEPHWVRHDIDGSVDLPALDQLSATGTRFVDMLSDDYLVVDTSKYCDVDTSGYLEIEGGLYRGTDWETCGGRTPNDDVIDGYVSVLVAGADANPRAYGDGVDQSATGAAENAWPYLASPNRAAGQP